MDHVEGLTLVGKQRNGTAYSPGLILVPGITPLTGNSLLFDGATGVSFGNLHDVCLGNLEVCPDGITVAAWVKIGNKSKGTVKKTYFMTTGGQTSLAHGWTWYLRNGRLYYNAKNSTREWEELQSPVLPREKWIHLMTTWHHSEGTKIYVNFKVVAQTTTSSAKNSPNGNNVFTMGIAYDLSILSAFGNFTIDELQIWKKSVTQEMIDEMQRSAI